MHKFMEITNERMEALQFVIGDCYHDSYSFLMFIANIDEDNKFYVFEGHPNGNNVKLVVYDSPEAFREKCRYSYAKGYWVDYLHNNYGLVEHWLAAHEKQNVNQERINKVVRHQINYVVNMANYSATHQIMS